MPQQAALLIPAGVIASALASAFQPPLVARPLKAVIPVHSTARGKATHFLSVLKRREKGQNQDTRTQLHAEESSGNDERKTSEPPDSTLPSSACLPPTYGAPLQLQVVNYGDEQVAEKWLGDPVRRASATPAPSEAPPPITITGLERPVERFSQGVSNGGTGIIAVGVGIIAVGVGMIAGAIITGAASLLEALIKAGMKGPGAVIAALLISGAFLYVAFALVWLLKALQE
ncbi:unnamed protein product [Vitrella brassicaformis CCMP3155]|uniref:V-ATPase proteolipid subunit C-like domain-containing protein n=2 Tax=Vitrella brassicaformis TaxID=1169539 RepID=A0A0G4H4X9_VITBC|nr:unnamed protein product [Vitrella brassicaformis CCMP3155]|eukprot:CEM38838.1 unnamed protein product [Vitrella brassicaformis CCMP3155]